jgi:hypothetical protein
MKVPRVIFWPLCAAASICQLYTKFLMSEGHIPVKISEANNPAKPITCLPGNIPPVWPTDLMSFYRAFFTCVSEGGNALEAMAEDSGKPAEVFITENRDIESSRVFGYREL